MAGLCEGGNEPAGSLKAICYATGMERQVSIVEDLAKAVNVKQALRTTYIVLSALRQHTKTARDLQNHLYIASGIRVSDQTDKARAHTAAVTRDFLRENEIEVMEWPAISPDLNPIELLWALLDRKVRNRHQAPQTLQELGDALKEE
ncbi:hypothetical protein ANN_13205 [Periplaneta americana]|uniref:Tc1-like transposase DDE domain-containing protein n=1 Tax=Periplaneta americana TaxID=6978 RepID=A0ABQ8TKU5_PERAM|nr:hypothetical protein ANN_13205 [Periplaneta americana]